MMTDIGFGKRSLGLVAMLVLAMLCGGLAPAWAGQDLPSVLILNSYHQGEQWSDHELSGIIDALQVQYPNLVPMVEMLDTKRFPSSTHLHLFKAHLLAKYRNRPPNLIVALDNPALDLLTQNGDDLFPGAPIVFAGINDYRPEMIAGREKITGVMQQLDVAGTLEMALSMHPGARHALVIHDYTASGIAVRQEAEAALAPFSGKLRITYSPDVAFDELGQELRSLDKIDIVLLLSYVTDRTGRTFTREESTRLITSLSPAPVYGVHEINLGFGIVGGMLLGGREHGRQAGGLAVRVLQGSAPGEFQPQESQSRCMLDFNAVQRFQIPERLWPEGALVVNRPLSLWNRHYRVLIPALAAILTLITLSLLLAVTVVRIRRTKAAIRKSEEKYRMLFSTIPLGITVTDQAGNILETNATAARLLGVPKEEHETRALDGGEWHAIRPDGTPMPVDEYAGIRALRENILVEHVEMGIQGPASETVWLSVSAVPLHLEGYGVMIMYTDQTQRKRAEMNLLRKDALLAAMLRNLPFDFWARDTDQRIIMQSDESLNLWGDLTTKELLNCHFDQETMDRWQSNNSRALAGEVVSDDCSLVIQSGERREYHNIVAPIREGEEILGILGINVDITERKRSEQEREKLRDQLVQVQKMEAIGRLAGGVAHDFNNMLGVILGQVEMAMQHLDPALPLHANLQQVQAAAQRSADLARQLLAFARRQTVTPRLLDLNETLEGMLSMLRRLIGEEVELVWRPGRDAAVVNVDPSQLDQVLVNLCVNARDALPGLGRITIETGTASFDEVACEGHAGLTAGDYALLRVSDNGCGMGPETLANLFEPFFTTKEMGKGTGLGLATVYGIVCQNKGAIDVESEPGRGTTFTIYLPRQQNDPERLARDEAAEPIPGGVETVLVVEDEPMILDLAATMLEVQGYTVFQAATPEEALLLAQNHAGHIDLLVTDVIMPGMNGRELAARLATLYPEMKLLFMSGYTADVIAHHNVIDEGVHFIQKPFSLKSLANKVRETLNAPAVISKAEQREP